MRILIIGMNYAPEVTGVAPFTTGIAEYLAQAGHKVTIVASVPHYPQWKVYPDYRTCRRLRETIAAVEVRRSRIYIPRRRSARSRILYDSSFAIGSLIHSRNVARPDLVVVISPPVQAGLTGALVARRWNVPCILSIEDLPLEAAVSVGLMRQGAMHAFGRRLEQLVYRLVSHIVIISPGFSRSLANRGVPASRVSIIPHWANWPDTSDHGPDLAKRKEFGVEPGDMLAVYSGNMGEKQGLGTVVDAARLAAPEDRLKVVLIGEGSAKRSVVERRERDRILNVKILPLQQQEHIVRSLSAADVFLLPQLTDVIDSVAPSKLLTYMAAGRPVIAAVNGSSEAARLVEAAGCGMVVRPEDPQALLDAIRAVRSDRRLRETMSASGLSYVRKHYLKAEILGRWEALAAQLVSATTAPLP